MGEKGVLLGGGGEWVVGVFSLGPPFKKKALFSPIWNQEENYREKWGENGFDMKLSIYPLLIY